MAKIELQSTGYETVPLYARKLVYYYGLTAINWGKLEQQLDVLLYTVNLPEFDQDRYRETPNTSFKQKCDLFKKWFVKDPRFGKFHARGERLHKSLLAAAKDRQLLFHSAVQEFKRGNPHSVRVVNLRHDNEKRKITVTRGSLTQSQVESMALRLARLTHGMRELCLGATDPEFLSGLRGKS